jgi:hypothetical protein
MDDPEFPSSFVVLSRSKRGEGTAALRHAGPEENHERAKYTANQISKDENHEHAKCIANQIFMEENPESAVHPTHPQETVMPKSQPASEYQPPKRLSPEALAFMIKLRDNLLEN